MFINNPNAGQLLKFYDLYSIDRDVKAKQAKQHESGSSRVIGGRSLWGNLLDVVCAKYGWTLHYVLWEISYINIMMMLTDSITVDYDAKDNDVTNDRCVLNADRSDNRERIRRELFE